MSLRWSTVAGLALLLAAAQGVPHAQEPQRASGTLREGVTGVLVDVVVRDRRGQPVRDLTEADFEILEDGVPQKVGSFTPIFGGIAPPAAASAPARPSAPAAESVPSASAAATGPAVTALVFDRLSPEGRVLAVQAAQGYVGTQEQTAHHIGVFGIDLSLTSHAPFTRNGFVLRDALEQLSRRASSSFVGPGGDSTVESPAGAGADAMLAKIAARMVREFEAMERDQQGYSTTNALFAVINQLATLPGRKSLVLFSEGMAIPPAVHRFFLGVIDAANRANVSIYTIDAAGLRILSEQALTGGKLNTAAQRGINSAYAGEGGDGPLTRLLEANEDLLRRDPESTLGALARYTGGMLINNTNDLRQGLTRIDEDLRNYYLLGYTPSNETFDGRFRTIEVKLKRSGLTVAARRGYFAVRDTGGTAVNTWEAPALGALEQKPVPNAFPVRAAGLFFPERGRPGLVPVLVEFGTSAVTFQPAEDGKTYTSDFAVLVRFVDGQNHVVRRTGQHYEVKGPVDELQKAARGEVIFYREAELPPGTYTMETVVHDAPSGKSSVRFSTIEVPSLPDGRLRMSSIVAVKGGERIAEADRRPENPLLVNDVAVRPNLGEPVSRSVKDLTFYLTVYPVAGGPAPDLRIELLHNGARVAHVPMLVSDPDTSGRSQQLGRLPIASLEPGTYELVASVKQGDEQVTRSTVVRIVE